MYHVVYWTFDCRETRHAGDVTNLAEGYYDTEDEAYDALDKIAEACSWIIEEGGGFTVEPNYRWLAEQKYRDPDYDPDYDFDNDAEYDY